MNLITEEHLTQGNGGGVLHFTSGDNQIFLFHF